MKTKDKYNSIKNELEIVINFFEKNSILEKDITKEQWEIIHKNLEFLKDISGKTFEDIGRVIYNEEKNLKKLSGSKRVSISRMIVSKNLKNILLFAQSLGFNPLIAFISDLRLKSIDLIKEEFSTIILSFKDTFLQNIFSQCQKCNKILKDKNAAFCSYCGEKLTISKRKDGP